MREWLSPHARVADRRAGIALVGASLMIGLGTLSLDEALKAIDLDAIALLLGMMIIVSQLRVSGFFELGLPCAVPIRRPCFWRQS
jgi:Na+/H+ antiporter NhaD/arsenite permease-like protein